MKIKWPKLSTDQEMVFVITAAIFAVVGFVALVVHYVDRKATRELKLKPVPIAAESVRAVIPVTPQLGFILVVTADGKPIVYEAVKGTVQLNVPYGFTSYTNSEDIERRFPAHIAYFYAAQPFKVTEKPLIETQTGAMFRP